VQRTIVVNQFTAAYLIEFTAEPRMVQPAQNEENCGMEVHS